MGGEEHIYRVNGTLTGAMLLVFKVADGSTLGGGFSAFYGPAHAGAPLCISITLTTTQTIAHLERQEAPYVPGKDEGQGSQRSMNLLFQANVWNMGSPLQVISIFSQSSSTVRT